jgi:GTP:adenosylcobinamide-phosphate guanylyltransferase
VPGSIALVLAGRRDGVADPLAETRGADHRALLEVAGVPMLVRVVRALRASGVERIVVSIGEPEALESEPELAALRKDGSLRVHRSLDSPSRSTLDALERHSDGAPVLITTADHALLTPEMVNHFLDAARRCEADVVVGAVSRDCVQARYPEAVRTYIPLRDGGWSGANLYLLRTPRARRAVEFWQRVERVRKRPWRMVSAFGPITLLLFLLRRLDLRSALERVSGILGAQVEVVSLPFPEAAIDVDRRGDLDLASRILATRECQQGGSA